MDLFAFDDEYVRRLRLHDPETVAHFESYIRELMWITFSRKLHSKEDLEDLLQETLARVFPKLESVQDPHKLGAFTCRIAQHVYQEKVRNDLKFKRLDAILPIQQQQTVLQDLIDEETRKQIYAALADMDKREREILKAVFLDEEDKDAICARFGVSREYLRVLVYRALEKFRGLFL